MENRWWRETIFLVLVIVLCVASGFMAHKFYELNLSNLTKEFISAAIGGILVLASITVTIHYQTVQETKKEFMTRLFEKKIDLYKEFLDAMFEVDDDGVIDREEICNLENLLGTLALISRESLVVLLSRFMIQLKLYGTLYFRSMTPKQINHFIENFKDTKYPLYISEEQLKDAGVELGKTSNEEIVRAVWLTPDNVVDEMRKDLDIVHGDVHGALEKFIKVPYDPYKLVKNPNSVG